MEGLATPGIRAEKDALVISASEMLGVDFSEADGLLRAYKYDTSALLEAYLKDMGAARRLAGIWRM